MAPPQVVTASKPGVSLTQPPPGLADAAFNLVYQEISVFFVPYVRPVYREALPVMGPSGRYRVPSVSPATYDAWKKAWGGHVRAPMT